MNDSKCMEQKPRYLPRRYVCTFKYGIPKLTSMISRSMHLQDRLRVNERFTGCGAPYCVQRETTNMGGITPSLEHGTIARGLAYDKEVGGRLGMLETETANLDRR